MTLSTLRAPLRAAAFALAALTCAPALAQGDDIANSDVYLGVFKDDVKPIVYYIFSDASTPELREIDGVAFFPNLEYKQEGNFDAAEGCRITYDFSTAVLPKSAAGSLSAKPFYGPNSDQKLIDPFTLPSYMARETVKALLNKKLVSDQNTAAPYFNCAGWIWARLLDQPKEFWNDLLKKKIAEEKAKQQ